MARPAVLAVCTTALGDTLLCTPALRDLAQVFTVDAVAHRRWVPLLAGNPHLRKVLAYRNNPAARALIGLRLCATHYAKVLFLHANRDALGLLPLLRYGEALGLPLWLPGRPEGRFALALQVIEADRLENPDGRPDVEFLRGGVEIDRHGAPVAYHLRKGHPGDGYLTGLAWERIPAFTSGGRRRVIHAHDKERSGQNRGKPFAAAVMGAFKMMDRYERAELQAAIVNAVIAAFIETPMAAEDVESLFGQAADPAAYLAARQQNRGALMPGGGAIIPLHPGERLASFTPNRPASNFPAFMDSILQRIAAGLNMSLQSFLRDFEKVSYAGGRLAILADWRFFQGRRHWLSTYWCQPVYELWLEEAVDLGLVEAPEFYANRAAYCRARWIGPGKGWIDPVKEAKGASLRIQGLMSTFEMECAEQGLDFEEVAEDLAREAGELERLGLPSPWRLKEEPMAEDGPGEGEREEP